MGFDLSQFNNPVATLLVAGSSIYIYSFRIADESALKQSSAHVDADARLRFLLTLLASHQEYDHTTCPEPKRLSLEEVEAWPPGALEKVAETLASEELLHKLWRTDADDAPELPTTLGESAPCRVSQLIDWRVARNTERLKRLVESARSPWGTLSDWVKRAQEAQATRRMEPLHLQQLDIHRQAIDARTNELADAHATATATERTATIADDVSRNFLTFVSLFTEGMKAQESAEARAFKLATRTFLATLVVAAIGTGFAIASFFQDRSKNRDDDMWQPKVLEQLQLDAVHRRQMETQAAEIARLRQQIDQMTAPNKPKPNPPRQVPARPAPR